MGENKTTQVAEAQPKVEHLKCFGGIMERLQ